MNRILFPDYENCGMNVVASALNYFGVEDSHARHPAVEKLLETKKYKNIVLMLFDGMGMDLLEHALPENSFLRSHLLCEMSAAYPSTTACATTSIGTAMPPLEHSWLGWDLYFKEIEKTVAVLINIDEETGEPAASYRVGDRYAPLDTVYHRLNEAGAAGDEISAFGTVKVDSLTAMREAVLNLCADEKRRYLYCYWNDPDHTMHSKGCCSPEVFEIVKQLDAFSEQLATAAGEDTLILITADHGLIDAEWLYTEDHPEIENMLLHMPSVEPRAAAFYVKPEYMEAFPDAFRAAFGDEFILLTADEFIRQGYLGTGKEHPKVRDFTGDYMALATGRKCIGAKRREHELIGMHAGLTGMEMRVPLIAARV